MEYSFSKAAWGTPVVPHEERGALVIIPGQGVLEFASRNLSRIPLRKTGLIVFGSRVVSIFTGLLFLIMITGWLTPARFGQWEVILTFVTFASYPAGWLGFWATRDVARGKMVGRTVILLNLLLSVAGAGIYFLISLYWSSFLGSSLAPFLLALLLVPLAYWSQAANSVATGYRPAAMGYSLLLSESAKLVVAYAALFVFRLELNGVILAMLASYSVQGIATTFFVQQAMAIPVDLETGKRWIRESWVPVVYTLATQISSADTVAASAVAGYILAGYYQASFQIGSLVGYAGYLTYALYPVLLRGGSDEAPDTTLDLILLFGIPMAAGVIALAPQLLSVLSTAYVSAGRNVSPALAVIGVAALVSAISGFFDSIILAKERADLEETRSFGTYMKSGFSFVSKVNVTVAIVYVVSVITVASAGVLGGLGISTVVLVWAGFQLTIWTAGAAIKLRRVRKVAKLSFPRRALNYLAVAAAMSVLVFLLATIFPGAGAGRFENGLRVAGIAVVGSLFYFGVLFEVDSRFRNLASSLLSRRPEPAQDESSRRPAPASF
ncbi:MAG TPA: hypothetical protein VEJ19_00715 [Nitrososphaerales archaeon]|nr:hypothetical protein [Nitrososphaerales archaeon]